MMMKILLITDHLYTGGKERRLLGLIKGLLAYPDIICELVILKDLIIYEEARHLNVPIHIFKRRIKKDPLVFFKLYRLYRKFKPDIIHSWGTMTSIYALPFKIFFRVKLVNAMVTNAICKRYSKAWIRAKITFPFSDKIVSNSAAGISAYKVPANKACVINNGFDFSRLKDIKKAILVRKQLNINTDYVIGMVGTIDYRKDYMTYILGAHKVLKKRSDITFLIVGEGENINNIKQDIKPEDKSKIVFTGRQKDVESIINIFDIGVLLTNTRNHLEGISNTIMEYMASAKPVIATTGGGTNEIVINYKTGFLIAPFSVDELAEKIECLLNNDNLRKEMGEKGRQQIKGNFNFDKMILSTIKIYNEVLAEESNIY
jgi:glycosyltransferase involved in cell wall biosynthesis